MKSDKSILFAFLLNLFFSIFELFGGVFTGSVAILSDAVHDFADAFSIGISYLLERKSKRKPDDAYTFGYLRYSVIGALITNLILIIGSLVVIYNGIIRLIFPTDINYNGMIIFAAVGITVNLLATIITHKGETLNQRAVSLHMLEDVLGWAVVLVGAIVMKFTDFGILDSSLSIAVALFIIISAIHGLSETLAVLLEKAPHDINVSELKEHILNIPEVVSLHHIHVWSLDGNYNCASLHVITNGNAPAIKKAIKAEMLEHGISHTTVEFECVDEVCTDTECSPEPISSHSHHHHHTHSHKHTHS